MAHILPRQSYDGTMGTRIVFGFSFYDWSNIGVDTPRTPCYCAPATAITANTLHRSVRTWHTPVWTVSWAKPRSPSSSCPIIGVSEAGRSRTLLHNFIRLGKSLLLLIFRSCQFFASFSSDIFWDSHQICHLHVNKDTGVVLKTRKDIAYHHCLFYLCSFFLLFLSVPLSCFILYAKPKCWPPPRFPFRVL